MALIFCFDTLLLFTLVPFLMALAKPQQMSIGATALEVVKRIVTHPLVIATAVGVCRRRCISSRRSRSTG